MSKHLCNEDGCDQRATDRCFECGEWRCAAHLVRIKLPTAAGYFGEVLCAACLQEHLAQSDRYGQVVVESRSLPAIAG